MTLRAPFPWFGGKSRVAHLVWARFGDVRNYVEPFFGSGAVLLGRPHAPKVETVNDRDCYLANFWRALRSDPEAVAMHAGDPVNEADLHARHRWLVAQREFRARIVADPDYRDAQIAGWWVWGLSLWIGSGWCAMPEWTGRANAVRRSRGVHTDRYAQRPQLSHETGVHSLAAQKRLLRGQGMGVHALGADVHAKRPHLATGGKGLMALAAEVPPCQLPELYNGRATGSGVAAARGYPERLIPYFTALAERMSRVRVCCGDWPRVLTPSVTTAHGTTAVFLDPPYSHAERDLVYREDDDIAAEVRAWALAHGDNPELHIALCGYEGEHEMPETWTCVAWKAAGGYGSQGDGRGRENAARERIWFSPHCLHPADHRTLFDEVPA